MDKQKLISIVVVVVVLIAGGLTLFFFLKDKPENNSNYTSCLSGSREEKVELCIGGDGYLYMRINDKDFYKNRTFYGNAIPKEELYSDTGLKITHSQNIIKDIKFDFEADYLNVYSLEKDSKLYEIKEEDLVLNGKYSNEIYGAIAENVDVFKLNQDLGCYGAYCTTYNIYEADGIEHVFSDWTGSEYNIISVSEIKDDINRINKTINVGDRITDESLLKDADDIAQEMYSYDIYVDLFANFYNREKYDNGCSFQSDKKCKLGSDAYKVAIAINSFIDYDKYKGTAYPEFEVIEETKLIDRVKSLFEIEISNIKNYGYVEDEKGYLLIIADGLGGMYPSLEMLDLRKVNDNYVYYGIMNNFGDILGASIIKMDLKVINNSLVFGSMEII